MWEEIGVGRNDHAIADALTTMANVISHTIQAFQGAHNAGADEFYRKV